MYNFSGISNSQKLEVLSSAVHKSPSALKHCVGTSKTYIRPVQCDLDVTPIMETMENGVGVTLVH